MTAPEGVTIGAVWTAKRGRRGVPDCTIRQVHRTDRAVTVIVEGERRTIPWATLRRDRRPSSLG